MFVFGVTSLMAAAITMTLPETKNIKLPDTIDEAENIGVNHASWVDSKHWKQHKKRYDIATLSISCVTVYSLNIKSANF